MSRTQEQKDADEALTGAIQAVWQAYSEGEQPDSVMTDYVVVSARQWWDEDGDSITAVMCTPRDGDMPIHRIVGLLDYALTRNRAQIAGNADAAEDES